MAQQHNDWADITRLDTFPKVLQHNAKNWPEQVAMREKEFGIWREFTWKDYENRVKWMALALQDLGIGEQDVVGLLGDNRPEWVWGELAHMRSKVSRWASIKILCTKRWRTLSTMPKQKS
ncbi:TPA: AMP-binding protein [Vibrio alginolyticus]